jgi:hypothetical protein
MFNLFKFAVLGDPVAGETEKRALLGFADRKPALNSPGNPATSNAAWRDDRTLDAWRYDVLYESLTAGQREGIERTIREWVDWFMENPGPAALPGRSRVGWLPNMQWPTAIGIHNLAVVSRDETLIRRVFEAIAGNGRAIAAKVTGGPGTGIDDRVLLRFGDDHDEPVTLNGADEAFTFSDCVHIRIGKDAVEADGPLRAIRLRVSGQPALIVNGKASAATVKDGFLELRGP